MIVGPLRLIYIPNKLIVSGNAAATVPANILAHEMLFRLGIASDVVADAADLHGLDAARLFKDVDVHHAVLVVIFGGVMPGRLISSTSPTTSPR